MTIRDVTIYVKKPAENDWEIFESRCGSRSGVLEGATSVWGRKIGSGSHARAPRNMKLEHRYIVVEGPDRRRQDVAHQHPLGALRRPAWCWRWWRRTPSSTSFYGDRAQVRVPDADVLPALAASSSSRSCSSRTSSAQVTVTDYLFAKDRIFAGADARPERAGALRAGVRRAWARGSSSPTWSSTCRRASTCCCGRIKKRGREFERKFDPDYLDEPLPRVQRLLLPLPGHAAAGGEHLATSTS